MARTIRNAKIDSRSARSKLPVGKTIHWVALTHGHAMGYRKGPKGGTWVAKYVGSDKRLQATLGLADDLMDADGERVLTHKQAQDKAMAWFEAVSAPPAPPTTGLAKALDQYEADLKTRGGDLGNIARLRRHVPRLLLDKDVSALTSGELRDWRDNLSRRLAAATVNRTCNAFKAALNLAADRDEVILSRNAWEKGLASLPDAEEARNVVVGEADIRKIVDAAYGQSAEFGLLVEVAAVTGARYGQIAGLTVGDLQDDRAEPRLMMPSSKKGKGVRKVLRRPLPITVALAGKLRKAAGDRPASTALLTKPSGDAWRKSDHFRPFNRAVAAAFADKAGDQKGVAADREDTAATQVETEAGMRITIYALRHSSIVRQILHGVPVRVVAVLHDTSVAMIEKNYSKYLADHTDALARAALFDVTATKRRTGRPRGTK